MTALAKRAAPWGRCVGLVIMAALVCLSAGSATALAQANPTQQATWAFEPEPDRYSPDAMLDLRNLNEKSAGEHGFIRLSEDGRDFVRGDGTPIRFWAVNSSMWERGRQELLEDHLRFLAKRGVNLVRWHGNMPSGQEGSSLTDFNAAVRDGLWRYVAAIKKEGIYVTISPYYPHATEVKKSWGIESPQRNMTCLLFFDPRVQDAYKGWLRAIFEPVNPHTGIALKDEPAVAIIQMQNEDSMLFWTIEDVKEGERELLQRKFGEWLTRKYGSLEAASKAWQGEKADGDDFGRGLAGLCHIWEMTRDAIGQRGMPGPGKAQRLADQTEFYTETMRNWQAEVVRFLREDIGCKQLVSAGNWRPADLTMLNDAERYSYTPTEVMGVNRYYTGGEHLGREAGWAIINGDKFSNISALVNPRDFPLGLKQVAGHPMIIPESSWVPPLGYQSEGPFLVSVFGSLTGVDAFYWFAFAGMADQRPLWPHPTAQWVPPASANGYMPSVGKWVADTPEILGNFPAAALMYRMGYVQRGRTVVHEERSLEDLWSCRVPIIAEDPGFDPNRDKAYMSSRSNVPGGVSPLAFLVGPVEVTYGGDPSKSQVLDLSPYLDEQQKVVRSVTGEVVWDYGKGICTLNAPKAQGVSGFLSKAGTFPLSDVTIRSGNDYASVLVVSMDDLPLSSSQKVLVQAGTIARPTDWADRPATWKGEAGREQVGLEVVNFGKAPWRIVDNDIAVTLSNPGVAKAVVLDMNGMPRGEVTLQRAAGKAIFRMPRDAMYLVLMR